MVPAMSRPHRSLRPSIRSLLGPLRFGSALCLAGGLLVGCGEAEEVTGPPIQALHVLPGGAADSPDMDFFALPFPSDLRLRPKLQGPTEGPVGEAELLMGYDLSRLPRLRGVPGRYVELIDGRIPGAGPGAAIYFRFAAPLDPKTLPADAAASVEAGAGAVLIDVTKASPGYGQRAPVLAAFHAEEGRTIGPNWLSLLPVPGLPLRERTTYAAVLTRKVRGAQGERLVRAPDLERLLAAEEPKEEPYRTAWRRYAPLRDYLEKGGIALDDVVAATVFTTQDATSSMLKLRRAVYAQAREPSPTDLRYLRRHDGLTDVFLGSYESPNFQEGDPPYWDEGGGLKVDNKGEPVVVRTEKLRFALTVPTGDPPPQGWPVILYAHGTGGDYQTFIREGLDLRAALVERTGADAGKPPVRMAMIGIDQVLHGPRVPDGADPNITFFNIQNLLASRDNVKQGAADDFQLLRLVEGFVVDKAPVTGKAIRFDKSRIYFVGHSQGGLTGPLFLAAEPKVKAGVLSGAGAVLILSLLHKTEPTDIAGLVESLLQEAPTPDHPLLNLLQAFFESSDPNNYGPLLFRRPPEGVPPKSVFQTMGLIDHFTPVPNLAAFALSLGVQPLEPRLRDLPSLSLVGADARAWSAGPVRGNVAGGKVTGGLRQYVAPPKEDGHFVIFDLWAARHAWSRFLASHVDAPDQPPVLE
jgi:predicted esterase